MMSIINSVPTTLLVDGHEAMFRDSFDATRVRQQDLLVGSKLYTISNMEFIAFNSR